MKRRKKVWVVVGAQGGYWWTYETKIEAIVAAKRSGYPLRVVPAILEYEVPKKEGKS